MRKKILGGLGLAAAGVVAMASVASATTTFDPSTGTGFVGKGDLQTPWGWSNKTLQTEASHITFSFTSIDSADYDVTCEFYTGPVTNRKHHIQTTTQSLADTVAYGVNPNPRQNKLGDVTGFNLIGPIGDPVVTSSGDIPTVNDTCLSESDNGVQGTVTAVTLVDGSEISDQVLSASDPHYNPPTGPTTIWENGISVHV